MRIKTYFNKLRLCGIMMLLLTVAPMVITRGCDISYAIITLPVSLMMIFGKETIVYIYEDDDVIEDDEES